MLKFFKDASIQYVKNKLYEYNKNNVAVLDYVLLKDPGYEFEYEIEPIYYLDKKI